VGGAIVDRVSEQSKGWVPIGFLVPLVFVLFGFSAFTYYYEDGQNGQLEISLTLVALSALFMIAPYSFPHGFFALRLGGKQAVGFVSGNIGAMGYIAAVVSGYVTGFSSSNSLSKIRKQKKRKKIHLNPNRSSVR